MNIDTFYLNLKNTTSVYSIVDFYDIRWALTISCNVNRLISYGLIETFYFKSVSFGIKM